MSQYIQADIKRDKLDIMLRILEVANVPVKKTHILYQAGINFYQLSKYLDLLLRTGMLEQIEDQHVTFRTTEKGRILMMLFSGSELEAVTSARGNTITNTSSKSSKVVRTGQ
jgi:predicted transcriptional regulator